MAGYFGHGDFVGIPRIAWGVGMIDKVIRTGLCPGGSVRMRRLLRLIESGRVDPRPLTTHRFRFDEVDRALHLMETKDEGTHKNHFQSMRRLLPERDRGLGTLIADLADRGLLDETIVWCVGEFGRTPKVASESPWNGGRHHFGSVFSTLVAGGGFQGGQVVGASDERAESVKDRPVYPGDLIGTMYELIGIDPEASLPHPRGDFIRATPGADEGMESGGRLAEII